MLIAHLPAGYILFKALNKKQIYQEKFKKTLLWGILLGSILPDFDTLWFYFISNRSEVHHSYWTHTPFFWTALCVVVYVVSKFLKMRNVSVFTFGIWISVILHLVLDTIAGQIRWAWPFSNRAIQLVEIPPAHSWWVISFIVHWTFYLEVGLIILAWLLFFRDRSRTTPVK